MSDIPTPKITAQDILTIGNTDMDLDVSKFLLSPESKQALLNLRLQSIADKLTVNSGNFSNDPVALTRLLMKSDIEISNYNYLLELHDTNLTNSQETGE